MAVVTVRSNTAERRGKCARGALRWQSAVAAIASALWHYRVARARGMVRFDIPKGPEASACALWGRRATLTIGATALCQVKAPARRFSVAKRRGTRVHFTVRRQWQCPGARGSRRGSHQG